MNNDYLEIKGWELQMLIGALEWERVNKQRVTVDMKIGIDAQIAARTDQVSDCYEYIAALKPIKLELEGGQFTLIETLAEFIAIKLLEHSSQAKWVEVRVKKHKVVQFTKSTSISITRNRLDIRTADESVIDASSILKENCSSGI